MAKINIIAENFFEGRQSWNYEKIVSVLTTEKDYNGFYVKKKKKSVLKRDALDIQSHCQIYLFNGSKWEFVYEEPFANCDFKKISYMGKATKEDFEKDADKAMKIALKIVL